MTKIKNTSTKRITFPSLDFSIGPNEIKDINNIIASEVLTCGSIVSVIPSSTIKSKSIVEDKHLNARKTEHLRKK